ncbi:MAG TPA: HYR domain-containing protein, partial [Saprospiraceae bacterium]|nr:HYR domain-containing protein [Saprospiraceae bacterium]
SGSTFPVGSNAVVWRATDAGGRSATCAFTITVVDNQGPTVTCPADIVVTGSGIPCRATVTYPLPTATDNCSVSNNGVYLFSGLASGSQFPAGVTVNTWYAQDIYGITGSCSFSVTVNCPTAPEENGVAVRTSDARITPADNLLRMDIAPNPAVTQVTIALQGVAASGGELTMMDALGRQVWRQDVAPGDQSFLLDLSAGGLAQGVYFVVLRSGEQTLSKRLLINGF